ncbi:MAG: fatty acid desaturase [Rubripirellula sp.]|nr:fatty acid desaturase [Rubripirellula sp.]
MTLLFAPEAADHKKVKFHPRVLGSPAPMFPGYEVDISERVDDDQKPDAVWHRDRAKSMIRKHPEIKQLFGNTRSTAAWCLLFAGLQIGLAVSAGYTPWWSTILVAYFIGSWINVNLFQLAHECNHNLVFKKTAWNRRLFTLTTLPMFLSAHHSWWIEHHVHHNDLGAKKDFITRRRTALLLTRQHRYLWATTGPFYRLLCILFSPVFMPYALLMLVSQAFRSAIGLIVYTFTSLLRGKLDPSPLALSILADEHLISGYEKYGTKRWAVVYPLMSFTMLSLLIYFGGWMSVVYLLLSQLFITGFLHPHNFGIILSNSHFHGHTRYQPSSSLYGWSNKIYFNFGLHTEHHDIMGIPWHRLGKLREIAPEYYDKLVKTKSYAGLAYKFMSGDPATLEEQFDNEDHRNEQTIGTNNADTPEQAAKSDANESAQRPAI